MYLANIFQERHSNFQRRFEFNFRLPTLVTNEGFSFLTTNYGHNEFAELQIRKFIFWPQICGSSWPFVELPGRIVFLPQLIGICCHRATKDSFLITQTLITCCQRLAGQNTCSFAEIIHKSNLYSEYLTAWLHACALDVIFSFCGEGGQIGKQTHKKNSQNKLD